MFIFKKLLLIRVRITKDPHCRNVGNGKGPAPRGWKRVNVA